MLRRATGLFGVLLLTIATAVPAPAQEGHPLTGTWSGDWGASPGERHHLTVVMSWDGKEVTGLINPGPDAVPLARVILDVVDWTVRLEADGKDASGMPVRIVADGRIDDLGSPNRTLSGTWMQGKTEGDFRLTRN